MPDALNPPAEPKRVFYATGRMLGVEDFQSEQDYHRGRLARALLQLAGTGTVCGLLVQTGGGPAPAKLEIQVTAGMALDRVGRIVEVPRTVCIVLNDWLKSYMDAWALQLAGNSPGTVAIADPNTAIHDAKNLMVDVFVSFAGCTRGVTPCFAAQDDFDGTDAFSANRLLDSFSMLLVLRTDSNPKIPLDPLAALGANQPPLATLRQSILSGGLGPQGTPAEYPPNFDRTAVFLARMLVPATAGTSGNAPVWDLSAFTNANIDNLGRLFVIPASLLSRWSGLGSGTQV